MLPEQRALLGLLSLGLIGQLVRLLLPLPDGAAPGDIRLLAGADSAAIVASRDSLARAAAPLGPGQRVDLNQAGALDLTRIPGIGAGMARRIVAERQAGGPFGDFEALARVGGIGPATLARLAPHVSFSGLVLPLLQDTARARSARKGSRRGARGVAASPPSVRLPEPAPSTMGAPPGIMSGGPPPPILNQGSAADIDKLPGIGRVRAQRIVAFRDSAGPFQSVHDLARVPGISLAFARRLWTAAGQR